MFNANSILIIIALLAYCFLNLDVLEFTGRAMEKSLIKNHDFSRKIYTILVFAFNELI